LSNLEAILPTTTQHQQPLQALETMRGNLSVFLSYSDCSCMWMRSLYSPVFSRWSISFHMLNTHTHTHTHIHTPSPSLSLTICFYFCSCVSLSFTVIQFRNRDGANQLGDHPLSNPPNTPYADYTNYQPVNPPRTNFVTVFTSLFFLFV
jgi:hypothetical protein